MPATSKVPNHAVTITRKNRQTGTPVTVTTAAALQKNPDDGGKWAIKCEAHGTIQQVTTKAARDIEARTPGKWCNGCKKIAQGAARKARAASKEAK